MSLFVGHAFAADIFGARYIYTRAGERCPGSLYQLCPQPRGRSNVKLRDKQIESYHSRVCLSRGVAPSRESYLRRFMYKISKIVRKVVRRRMTVETLRDDSRVTRPMRKSLRYERVVSSVAAAKSVQLGSLGGNSRILLSKKGTERSGARACACICVRVCDSHDGRYAFRLRHCHNLF